MKTANKTQKLIKIGILLFLLSPITILAQTAYKLSSGTSNVKVLGTSNVHDWTMTANDIESSGVFKFNSRDEMIDLSTLKFTIAAKSLTSGKSSMDSRTYKSIKESEFPKITY